MSIGSLPESLSQGILVGMIFVGRLGVVRRLAVRRARGRVRGPAQWVPSLMGT